MSEHRFSVTFHGVRGSHGVSGPEYCVYGGNTPCVEVRCGMKVIIFDAGSGIRKCGKRLLAEGYDHAFLLFSHVHWDHIQGFPFFPAAYKSDFGLDIYAGKQTDEKNKRKNDSDGIKSVLECQMKVPFFPISFAQMPARMRCTDFRSGDEFNLSDDIHIKTAPLNHPNGATGYCLSYAGKKVSYVTDTEHQEGMNDENVLSLMEDSDLVIYDCAYNAEQIINRKGWGHSTWMEATRLCKRANVRRMAMFHHDPDNDDKIIAGMEQAAQKVMAGCFAARENTTITLVSA